LRHAALRSSQHRPFQHSGGAFCRDAARRRGNGNRRRALGAAVAVFPWFSKNNLSARLAAENISYLALGDSLGGRPQDDSLYRAGVADYEAIARQPKFLGGLDQVLDAAARARVCLMCAEREPLDCHRCLLVARKLAERGLSIGHILHDGTVEPHAATEERLLALDAKDHGLFAAGQSKRLAAAYRRRAQAVAYRQKPRAPARATRKR
jgi:hypothetical protein